MPAPGPQPLVQHNAEAIEIDTEIDILFDVTKWREQHGNTYPDNPPPQLRHAQEKAFSVPREQQQWMPMDDTTIAKFLQQALPRQIVALNTGKPSDWFSNSEPTTDLGNLQNQDIPDGSTLERLTLASPQAWLDGRRSIAHPNLNNGKDHFPLWALTYWTTMSERLKCSKAWRSAADWVNVNQRRWAASQETSELVKNSNVSPAFGRITIGSTIKTRWGALTVNSLPRFLGDQTAKSWMSDESMDMMMDDLVGRVKRDAEKRGRVWVLPTMISQAIMTYGRLSTVSRQLEKWERLMAAANGEKLYLPFNVNGNHWVTCRVNLRSGTIAYGDSLGWKNHPKPKVQLKSLKKWMLERLKVKKVHVEGAVLKCMDQVDAVSCGLAVANAIAVDIFGEDVLHPAKLPEIRIAWFLRLTRQFVAAPVDELVRKPAAPMAKNTAMAIANILNPPSTTDTAASKATYTPMNKVTVGGPKSGMSDADPTLNSSGSVFVSSAVVFPAPMEVDDDGAVNGGRSEGKSEKGRSNEVEIEEGVWGSPEPDGIPPNEGGKEDAMDLDADAASNLAVGGLSTKQLGKRPRPPSIESTDSEGGGVLSEEDGGMGQDEDEGGESGSEELDEPSKRRERKNKKKSAAYTTEKRRAYKNGRIVPVQEEIEDWRNRIRSILPYGPHVQFNDEDHTIFWCPKCHKWLHVKELNDVTRFRSHINRCKGQISTPKIFGFFKKASATEPSAKPLDREMMPCPGLSEKDDERVGDYLARSSVSGGGGVDPRTLAINIYNKALGLLSQEQKDRVRDEQEETRKWRNDYNRGRVYAKDCVGRFLTLVGEPPKPCRACHSVFTSTAFKSAIAKPVPSMENRKYLNKVYINERLGRLFNECRGLQKLVEDDDASKSPYLRYALGVLAGDYDDKTFNGFIEAYVAMKDREAQGKGMQNFKYTPQFLAFCQDIRTTNPAAYRGLQTVFRVPTESTLQKKIAEQPLFPYELCDRNFELVRDHLDAIEYDGPVGLGCDDTKLSSGRHLVWDATAKSHFLIGGSQGPVQVLNVKEIEKAMDDTQERPATKLRLWVLSIPYPKIPPVIVAAQAIPDNFDAETLANLSLRVIRGLVSRKINLVSYSCDGSDVERSSQRVLATMADRVERFQIPSPLADEGVDGTEVTIPVFDGQHIAIGQDSKHALKTFRNNLYSGARLLTLGNFVSLYARIRDMALNEASPLYPRDVDKVDRQDDSAATRLFSADVLEFMSKNHPEYLGEIVYLFVFGELIDAYQNRFITHHERVKMVLRALHFLNHWEMYLKVSGFSKAAHTISPQAIDITRTLINGYLALLHIHRDVLKGKFPFLPWLHSTEPCEHVFGEARRIIKEFNFRDFVFMIPKLKNRIRLLMRRFRVNPKARAVGYVHTYFDTLKLDAVNLSIFPTLTEMGILNAEALAEVESLLFLLGIIPSRLRELFAGSKHRPTLPDISTWYHPSIAGRYPNAAPQSSASDPDKLSSASDDSDDENASIMSTTSSMEESGDTDSRQRLAGLLSEPTDHLYEFAQRKLTALRAAAFTLDADDFTQLQASNSRSGEALQDPDGHLESTEDVVREDAEGIREFELTIKDVAINEPNAPLGLRGLNTYADLDLAALVELRRAHETDQAAKSARTRTGLVAQATDDSSSQAPDTQDDEPTSLRKDIYNRFNEILKDRRNHASAGTASRAERWTGTGATEDVTGNAANAKAVAAATATKAATKRRNIFEALEVPGLNLVSDARVSTLRPLRAGDFIFFLSDSPKPGTVSLGKILALYTRTAGKGVRNAAAEEVTNVSALTRIAIQVFEHSHFAQFTSIPTSTAGLSTNKFLLIPPHQLLTRLTDVPSRSSDTATSVTSPVHLSSVALKDWKILKAGGPTFVLAMKAFTKRTKDTAALDEVE